MKRLCFLAMTVPFLASPAHAKTVDVCYPETLLAKEEETLTIVGYTWLSDKSEKWNKAFGGTIYLHLTDVPVEKSRETIDKCSIVLENYKERLIPKSCKHGTKVTATGRTAFDFDLGTHLKNAKIKCGPSDISGGAECTPFRAAGHRWADLLIEAKGIFADDKVRCEKWKAARQAAKEAHDLAKGNCANKDTTALWRSRAETTIEGCP